MSEDIFELPLEKISRNPNAANEVDTNVMRGFKDAVRNGQVRMALTYLTFVIDVLVEQVQKEEAADKKPAARKTAATKEAAESESE